MKKYKTKALTIILRSDNILEAFNNKDWNEPETLEIAKENAFMLKKVIDGQSVGLLVEIPHKYVTKEILTYYQNFEMGAVARAMFLNSFAAKVVGNLYFKLSKGKLNEVGRAVPTKLFTKKAEAVEWLLEQIEKSRK
ncbi:MAG: hypothetical protein JKY03_03285 [Aureispira sp.]|nr:hypothetical protein [Aureispira sp.]